MTAVSVFALCVSRGLRLAPSGEGVHVAGPKPVRDELREVIRACKRELVNLLRAQRQEEVSREWAAAYGRLECQFSSGLDTSDGIAQPVVNAWNGAETDAEHVSAEYVAGKVQRADFEAALSAWEAAVMRAMEFRATCSDCGARAVVLVGVDYDPSLRYCARCIRPAPTGQKGQHHA